ncbi:MAG TPA: hypothetical protein PLB96_09325 [Syntrophales bacterium]|nr:hypothetical protein [Syntrophales bacterium]
MPIPDYNGETFAAFADISGFKEMMKHDNRAVKALDHFYTSGYQVLHTHPRVHGIFISDCAVLFVNDHESLDNQLQALLEVVEELNRAVLQHDIMLATSIARGQFSYHQRLEFPGIEKNLVYGNAYVAAFLDNEAGLPRIQPGQCRIAKRGLNHHTELTLPRLSSKKDHYYFYWMIRVGDSIESFTERYADVYQQKYRGMLEAIKDAANNGLGATGDTLRASPAPQQ